MEQELVIQRIKELGQKILPEGASLWLFGSRARGDASPDSDYDLLILLDKDHITRDDHDNYGFPLRQIGWDISEEITLTSILRRTGLRGHTPLFIKMSNKIKSY